MKAGIWPVSWTSLIQLKRNEERRKSIQNVGSMLNEQPDRIISRERYKILRFFQVDKINKWWRKFTSDSWTPNVSVIKKKKDKHNHSIFPGRGEASIQLWWNVDARYTKKKKEEEVNMMDDQKKQRIKHTFWQAWCSFQSQVVENRRNYSCQ